MLTELTGIIETLAVLFIIASILYINMIKEV